MRRPLTVGAIALTVFGLGIAPAAAAGAPHGGSPSSAPGLARSGVERPAQAETPVTGRINGIEHGNGH